MSADLMYRLERSADSVSWECSFLAPGMVLWSNSDRTCKTSAGVIFIPNPPHPPTLFWSEQFRMLLYCMENSHRSHPIMKLMTCYGEFRIHVWWSGRVCWILDCWLPFPCTDVTFEQSGAIDVGCSHSGQLFSYLNRGLKSSDVTIVFTFHFFSHQGKWHLPYGLFGPEGMENAGKEGARSGKNKGKQQEKIGGNVWNIGICNTVLQSIWLIKVNNT